MTIEFANSGYWGGSQIGAAMGMFPRQHEIAKDTYLYRFVDRSKGDARRGADGLWWFEYEHFQTIKRFASEHGYPLGYAARLFAAILYEWSEVNAYVKARVSKGPLLVWKGRGKQVTGKRLDSRDVTVQHGLITGSQDDPSVEFVDAQGHGHSSKMTPMQGPREVYQLCIPGLGSPHYQFENLMEFIDCVDIETG